MEADTGASDSPGAGAGMTREVKVTKRSFENEPKGCGTFTSSEYARVVDAPKGCGTFTSSEYVRVVDTTPIPAIGSSSLPPSAPVAREETRVYARRRVSRYRVSSTADGDAVDGMTRVVAEYFYSALAAPAGQAAMLRVKFRDFVTRPEEG